MSAPERDRLSAPKARSGDVLGRYELLAPIAAGGMAEVFVARARGEAGFERLVAIKRILPELADDPRFVEMFLDEGRLAGLITSPHVVQVLDVARADDGSLYMALDLVRGVPLSHLLDAAVVRGERISVPVLVGILAQAADGLAAAHEARTAGGEPLGLVHRDVSPQNILVGADGRARIADFGIARALHRRSTTAPGELRGKLGYFAPEQVVGKPATTRSDVFALCVVAWEAFAGRRLFRGASPAETLREIRTKQVPSLHLVRDDVPTALAAVVARGLAKGADARVASARELAEGLRRAAKEAPASEIARSVRELVGGAVDALDDAIRDALDTSGTTVRALSPTAARGPREDDTRTTTHPSFATDATTTITTSKRELERPMPPASPARPRGRGLVVAGVLVALALVALAAGTMRSLPDGAVSAPDVVLVESSRAHPDQVPTRQPALPTSSPVPDPGTAAQAGPRVDDEAAPEVMEGPSERPEPARPPESRAGRGPRVRRGSRPSDTERHDGLRSAEDFARTLERPSERPQREVAPGR